MLQQNFHRKPLPCTNPLKSITPAGDVPGYAGIWESHPGTVAQCVAALAAPLPLTSAPAPTIQTQHGASGRLSEHGQAPPPAPLIPC